MLVLARKVGEAVVIGSDIEVVVLDVRGSGDQVVVRLGIEAPDSVRITRKEVVEAVAAENRRAASTGLPALEGLFGPTSRTEEEKPK